MHSLNLGAFRRGAGPRDATAARAEACGSGHDEDRRRWLCVAYAFPPIHRSGTHRTLGFVRHLDALGWDATVLTVVPGGEPMDSTLLRHVPGRTRVLRTRWVDYIAAIKGWGGCVRWGFRARGSTTEGRRRSALAIAAQIGTSRGLKPAGRDGGWKDWFSRLLITPDSRVGWLVPAVTRGLREIRRTRPAVIYSTSPCMTAHLVGRLLSKVTRVPWVADFRDPWRDNPFRDLKHPSLEWLDAWLERAVLRAADHVVCATPTCAAKLVRRVPGMASKCSTILNGFDAADFERVSATRMFPEDHVVLTHCGDFYGPRRPDAWFAAIAKVIGDAPHLRARLRLVLLGDAAHDGRSLRRLADEAGIGACVQVMGRRGHGEALAIMKGSDVLLLAGQAGIGGALQVPNKLFEYLALKRPIIAAVRADNPAIEILREARAEAIVCPPDDAESLARAIRRVVEREAFDVARPWSGVAAFDRAHRARQLAEVFECASSAPQVSAHSAPRASAHPEPQASACAASRTPKAPIRPQSPNHKPARTTPDPHQPGAPIPASVILPLSGGIVELHETLAALASQSRPPDEAIVAPLSNAQAHLGQIAGVVERYGFARVISGKRCNLADARNRAVRMARNEIIVCTQPGCVPERNWLERITAPLGNHRNDVVAGVCVSRRRAGTPVPLGAGTPGPLGALFERVVGSLEDANRDRPIDPLRMTPDSRSMALRKSAWVRAGGFPNWLDGDEDTLFAMKLRSLDPPVGFAIAVHAVTRRRPLPGAERAETPVPLAQRAGTPVPLSQRAGAPVPLDQRAETPVPLGIERAGTPMAVGRAAVPGRWFRASSATSGTARVRSLLGLIRGCSRAPSPRLRPSVGDWLSGCRLAALYRAHRDRACGEAQMGRGGAARRRGTLCVAVVSGLTCVAAISGTYGWAALATLFGIAAVLVAVCTQHRRARRVARALDSSLAYLPGALIGAWISLAMWRGRWVGHRDRRRQPDVFVDRLHAWLDSTSADLDHPPWMLAAAPVPRTLVVAWDWPPCGDPAITRFADLLRAGATSGIRVLTRCLPPTGDDTTAPPAVETHYVDWPLLRDRNRGIWQRLAERRTMRAMIRRAEALAHRAPFDRVLCLATHPTAGRTAARIARLLDLPLVVMIPERCAGSAVRARKDRSTDRTVVSAVLRSAWMVIAETEERADACRRVGVDRVVTLGVERQPAGDEHRLMELLRWLVTGPTRTPRPPRDQGTSQPPESPRTPAQTPSLARS